MAFASSGLGYTGGGITPNMVIGYAGLTNTTNTQSATAILTAQTVYDAVNQPFL